LNKSAFDIKGGDYLNFISLIKWKKPPKRDIIEQSTKRLEELSKKGIKLHVYWTLGRYDAVTIIEAPTENEALKTLLLWKDVIDTETMVAIPREEAIKLL
jgi:uncharacterized protein with GYD domain